jgi:hypothetical protein
LDLPDLPVGDWTMIGEQIWRSGYLVPHWGAEVPKRSRKAGGFATRRSYRQTTRPRGFWVQIAPYGLPSDAEAAVPRLLSMAYKNPKFSGTATEVREAAVEIRGVGQTFAEERSSTGSPEGPSNTKYVVGSISHIVFMFACYELGTGWSWDEVISIAEIQAEKIKVSLSEFSDHGD